MAPENNDTHPTEDARREAQFGRHSGLMVSALDSGLGSLGSSPGWGKRSQSFNCLFGTNVFGTNLIFARSFL